MGYVVVKMPVTDADEPHTPAWSTKYKIIQGNDGGFFNVSTGPNQLEGIVTTVKVLLRCDGIRAYFNASALKPARLTCAFFFFF